MRPREIRPFVDRSDRKFMEELYQSYKRLMFSTAQKYAAGENDVEDIMQSSVEKLMRQIPKLRSMEERAVAAYVFYTVKSVGLDWCRSRKRYMDRFVSLEEREEEQPIEDTAAEPFDERLISLERKARLKEIWPTLSEEDQILLEGRYIWGLTDHELAEQSHCKPDSIRMKLTRARRRALQAMEEKEGATP